MSITARDQLEEEALTHLGALRSFAFQLCRDEQYSHELVQETMSGACRSFHVHKQGTDCRAWLFQICKNSTINAYRRKQLEPRTVDFLEETSQFAATGEPGDPPGFRPSLRDDSNERNQRRCLSDEIIEALNALPGNYQTAVILSDIEDHSCEEIAEFMQVPFGTVRSRIHRGRRVLAKQISAYAQRIRWGVAA